MPTVVACGISTMHLLGLEYPPWICLAHLPWIYLVMSLGLGVVHPQCRYLAWYPLQYGGSVQVSPFLCPMVRFWGAGIKIQWECGLWRSFQMIASYRMGLAHGLAPRWCAIRIVGKLCCPPRLPRAGIIRMGRSLGMAGWRADQASSQRTVNRCTLWTRACQPALALPVAGAFGPRYCRWSTVACC